MKEDGTMDTLSKRERLQIERTREKLELNTTDEEFATWWVTK